MLAPQILHSRPKNQVASAVKTAKMAVVTYVLLFKALVGFPFLPILAVATPMMEARRPIAA